MPTFPSVYREYKKDTNSIATWLASTAKECGYPAALLPSAPSAGTAPATGGRLKGKARTAAKKAKGKGQGGPGTKPQGGPVRYIISIKDFVPLAECISASKIPSLCIPQVFFTTLDRVISVRSGFSQELKGNNAAPDAKSDAKHSHFVGILKKVREALEQFKPAAASPTPDPVSTLANKFDALKVYVPSEEFVNAPDIERPKPATERAEIFEVDPSQSLEEAIIAFYMMCMDLGEIRAALWSFWTTAASEKGSALDPAVLAIVTNTGIEFGKNIIEEMLPIFEPHGGVRKIMDYYLSFIPMIGNLSIYDLDSWAKDSESAEEFYNILSQCYYMECNVLDNLAKVPWRGVTSIYPEGAFGKLNPETDWDSKTVDQKIKQDRLITTELYFEALALVHHVPDYPFTDEFVRGVKQFKETKKIPFSLVFASQVNLDIHHAVGDYAETSVDTLLKRLSHMEGVLESTVNLHKKLKSPHWSSSNQGWLQQTMEGFKLFLKDPLHEAKTLAPDMEELIRIFGEEQFFVGGKPDNTSAYVNRFMLQVGVSASTLTNRPRRSKKIGVDDFSRAGGRFLTTRATFHRRFQDRYHNNANQMNWTPESISEILSLSEDGKKRNESKPVRSSPPELLRALGIALQPEVYELSFPYLLMHRANWTFLNACKMFWDPMLRDSFGSDYMEREWQLPFLVGQVLVLADGEDDSGLELAGVALNAANRSMANSVCMQHMYRLCGRDFDVPEEKLELLTALAMDGGVSSDFDDYEDTDDDASD